MGNQRGESLGVKLLLLLPLISLALHGFHVSSTELRPEPQHSGRRMQSATAPMGYSKAVEFAALQAVKASLKDPKKLLKNWVGQDPCNPRYTGVFCEQAASVFLATKTPLGIPMSQFVVTGLDLNGFGLGGTISPKITMLKYLGYIHMSHNSLTGSVPPLNATRFLCELDLAVNSLTGVFPPSVLALPKLRYLDLRFNKLSGALSPQLFQMGIDVLALNNNQFTASAAVWAMVPKTPASILVLANNPLKGSMPNLATMKNSLEEINLSNTQLTGAIPASVASLSAARVIDLSSNSLTGALALPDDSSLLNLTVLNVANNRLLQNIQSLRPFLKLPRVQNLSISTNYFNGQVGSITGNSQKLNAADNCIVGLPNQRAQPQCAAFIASSMASSSG